MRVARKLDAVGKEPGRVAGEPGAVCGRLAPVGERVSWVGMEVGSFSRMTKLNWSTRLHPRLEITGLGAPLLPLFTGYPIDVNRHTFIVIQSHVVAHTIVLCHFY